MEYMITAKYEDGVLVSTETKAIPKTHKINVGSLVEVGEIKDEMLAIFDIAPLNKKYEGMRAFVVRQHHNNAGECVYDLSLRMEAYKEQEEARALLNSGNLQYGSKEYVDQVAKFQYAAGSMITDIKESDLIFVK